MRLEIVIGIKRNPRWWKLKSLFKWAVWKETCDDHRGFRFVFRWPFRVRSSSHGFSRNYSVNMNREQLVPSMVFCGFREQEQGTLMELVAPRGRQRLKWRRKKKNWDVVARRRACFLEFWMKFSGVSSTSKLFISDAKVLKVWRIYVLGVRCLTNICVMYVMMYVMCVGRTYR